MLPPGDERGSRRKSFWVIPQNKGLRRWSLQRLSDLRRLFYCNENPAGGCQERWGWARRGTISSLYLQQAAPELSLQEVCVCVCVCVCMRVCVWVHVCALSLVGVCTHVCICVCICVCVCVCQRCWGNLTSKWGLSLHCALCSGAKQPGPTRCHKGVLLYNFFSCNRKVRYKSGDVFVFTIKIFLRNRFNLRARRMFCNCIVQYSSNGPGFLR